jgi:hypothetical protein
MNSLVGTKEKFPAAIKLISAVLINLALLWFVFKCYSWRTRKDKPAYSYCLNIQGKMKPETSLQMSVTQPKFHTVSSFKYNNNMTIRLLIILNNLFPAVTRCHITQTAGTHTESVSLTKADDH